MAGFYPETRGARPVLAFDVVDNGGFRPGEKRGNDQADALAASRGGECENVFGTIVAEIVEVVSWQD